MGLAVTAAAALALGWELSLRMWRRDEAEPLSWSERLLYATLLAALLWLASTWALALPHLLVRPALIARTAAFGLAAIVLMVVRLVRERPRTEMRLGAWIGHAVALLPLFIWIDVAIWRGAVTPPVSIDALSYHLPKALLFARAAGYDALRSVRFILAWRPCNYELLLADGIVLDGVDTFTEWISTFFYVAFVIASVALALRWWGSRPRAAVVVALLAGGMPVALLHSADYKNDVMAAFFTTAALVTLGRWLSSSDTRALVLTIVAAAAAAGTKTPAALFAVLIVIAAIRLPLRRLIVPLLVSIVLSFFVGGAAYVSRIGDRFATVVDSPVANEYSSLRYGHFVNLVEAPVLLIAESFSPTDTALRMPGMREPMRWSRFELYYSELGIPFSLCAIAFPFCLVLLRAPRRREQLIVTAVALLSFVAIVPFDGRPAGRYLIGLPRFALVIAPVVFAATIVPLVERAGRVATVAIIATAAVVFVVYAVRNAENDIFAPFDYVTWASDHRGARLPPIGPGRAPAVIDEMAGPHDRVAIDAGVSSLMYLAYGAQLTRPVDLIPPTGPLRIAPDVKWVGVDRLWTIIWGHPALASMATNRALIGHGRPSDEDLRVFRALSTDPHFQLVYFKPSLMQAVFRRR